ncbi:MAG: hypothetical protein IK066_02040, partial [Kiritimatiellae bacterium]|nr:hypothetical protein [Kiritimatiellia bacterium]
MGIFGKLASLFGGGKKSGKSAVKTFLVDGARLLDEKTGRRLSPREQLALIGALGRLAKQEEFAMSVIFETDRPLREAPDGGEYQGVTVWYAETAEELIEKALKTARRTGVTLVTSGPNLESRATEEKVSLLSSGTFKKAFLTGFSIKDDGRGRGDRGDRGDRGGGGNG